MDLAPNRADSERRIRQPRRSAAARWQDGCSSTTTMFFAVLVLAMLLVHHRCAELRGTARAAKIRLRILLHRRLEPGHRASSARSRRFMGRW